MEIYAVVSRNGYKIYSTSYLSDKDLINIFLLRLNKKLQPTNFTEIHIKTFSDSSKNNDFKIKYNKEKKQTVIEGELFDVQPLLKSLYKTKDKKAFGKDLNEWHQGMYDALPKISCKSEERKEVYIACDGDVLPCCWWGDDHWKYKYKRENHKKPEFYSIMDGLEINLHKSNYDFNKITTKKNK